MANTIQSKLTVLAAGMPFANTLVSVSYKNKTGFYDCRKFENARNTFEVVLTDEEYLNSENIGGMFTYIYPNQTDNTKRCWWFVRDPESDFKGVTRQQGYVCNGYHADTYRDASLGGMARQQAQRIQGTNEPSDRKTFIRYYAKAMRQQFGFNDSLVSGNCLPGTKAFQMRCRLDSTKKYRGDFLFKTARERSTNSVSFVENMVKYRAKQLMADML